MKRGNKPKKKDYKIRINAIKKGKWSIIGDSTKKRYVFAILMTGLFLLSLNYLGFLKILNNNVLNSNTPSYNSYTNNENGYNNGTFGKDNVTKLPKISGNYVRGNFSDVGNDMPWNTSFSIENELINNNSRDDFSLSALYDGKIYNQTGVRMNFTQIYAPRAPVDIQTISDDALGFDQNKEGYKYAMSFGIPISTYLNNFSMFIQYPGGNLPWSCTFTQSYFYLEIYNSIQNPNGNLIPGDLLGHVLFNLTHEDFNNPAKWYVASFTDLLLNVSNTINNTFFSVFNIAKIPNTGFGASGGIYYANDTENDEFNGCVMIYNNSLWSEYPDIDLLLKINMDPIHFFVSADEVNLTVNGIDVGSDNIFEQTQLIEPSGSEFLYNVESVWFEPVIYNMSYELNLTYRIYVPSSFEANIGENITHWRQNSTISLFPSQAVNKRIIFYHPQFWKFNYAENGTATIPISYIHEDTNYVEISAAGNDNWAIFYNQTYIVENFTISQSIPHDPYNWTLINQADNNANFTEYINISIWLNITSGISRALIYSDHGLEINNKKDASSNGQNYFDIWRPDKNTSITHDNSILYIDIAFSNNTYAGIVERVLNIKAVKMSLEHENYTKEVYKNDIAYEEFRLSNLLNGELVNNSNWQIFVKNDAINQWKLLKENKDYLLNTTADGNHSLYLLTESDDFSLGNNTIEVNISADYFIDTSYTFNLTIIPREMDLTFLNASHPDYIYRFDEIAEYYFNITDNITHNPINDLQVNLMANFSGGDDNISLGEYSFEFNSSNAIYIIKIYNEILFKFRPIENITINMTFIYENVYNSKNYSIELKVVKGNMFLNVSNIPDIPFNSTDYLLKVNISDSGGPLDGVIITANLGNISLKSINQESGVYAIQLNSTGLLPDHIYLLNITCSKDKYNDLNYGVNILVTKRTATIFVSNEFRNITMYQDNELEIFAIVKDNLNGKDILDGLLQLYINNTNSSYRPINATLLSSEFSWFSFNLVGNFEPGTYNGTIKFIHQDYFIAEEKINITILAKKTIQIQILSNYSRTELLEGQNYIFTARIQGDPADIINQTVIFRFIIWESSSQSYVKTIRAITDENGRANVQFYIPPGTKSINLEVIFEGTNMLNSSSSLPIEISILSKEEFLKHEIIKYGLIGLVVVSLFAFIRVEQKRKEKARLREWQAIYNIYLDALNIYQIMVIHKASGVDLISSSYSSTKLDDTLVSGFLTAFASFGEELKESKEAGAGKNGADNNRINSEIKFRKENAKKRKDITQDPNNTSIIEGEKSGKSQKDLIPEQVMDYGTLKIYMAEGNLIRLVLILNDTPSERLKSKARSAVQILEEKYSPKLEKWDGKREFAGMIPIIEKELNLDLLFPIKINEEQLKSGDIKLGKLERAIIDTARHLIQSGLPEKELSIQKLLNYFTTIRDISKLQTFWAIYQLKQKNILISSI